MSYIGETPVKKMARVMFWNTVATIVGGGFRSGHYVALASAVAGDAATLKGMGVQAKNITLVDIDASACERASRIHPDVEVVNDSVLNVAKRWSGRFHPTAVYLDYCSHLTPSMVGEIASMFGEFWCGTKVVGVNLLKGREKGAVHELLHRMRKGEMPTWQKAADRHAVLFSLVNHLLAERGRRTWIWPKHVFTYTTRSPMAIGVFEVKPLRPAKDWQVIDLPPVTADMIRDMCLGSEEWAAQLNVPPTTLAAWRAHRTRGSYSPAPVFDHLQRYVGAMGRRNGMPDLEATFANDFSAVRVHP